MPRSDDDLEPQLPAEETQVAEMEDRFGAPSSLTCPDCGGALWEVDEGRVVRYQCHVGHQYAPDALDGEQREAVDSALWSAVRVLEEHAALKMRMAKRAADNNMHAVSKGFVASAHDAHAGAQRIRSLLFTADAAPLPPSAIRKRAKSDAHRPRTTPRTRTGPQKKARTKRRD